MITTSPSVIAKIPITKPFIFHTDEEDQIIIPQELGELQDFLETMWDTITEGSVSLIPTYNKAAELYNNKAGSAIIQILNKKQMAKKKKVAKKKAAPVKKIAPVKNGDKVPTQKEQVIALAEKGKTIDEVVEATGIQKSNVSYYFSKFKLHKYTKKD